MKRRSCISVDMIICVNGAKKDVVEAAKFFRKAAELGHARAQCGLGACYFSGHGMRQDFAQAVSWWRKSAAQGNANAQWNL